MSAIPRPKSGRDRGREDVIERVEPHLVSYGLRAHHRSLRRRRRSTFPVRMRRDPAKRQHRDDCRSQPRVAEYGAEFRTDPNAGWCADEQSAGPSSSSRFRAIPGRSRQAEREMLRKRSPSRSIVAWQSPVVLREQWQRDRSLPIDVMLTSTPATVPIAATVNGR